MMTHAELIEKLKRYKEIDGDPEDFHRYADDLLLKYINNDAVTKAFNSIPKWYA
jgi:hypothetical protein